MGNKSVYRWSLLGLLLLAAVPATAEHIGIVATVNDDVITSTDLDERRALVMSNSDIPDTPENRKKIAPHILQSLIDESLELQEAKHQSITISDADVDKAVDNLGENKNEPAGSLKKSIEAKGLSLRSLRNQVKARLAWSKVVQRKLKRNVTISKDELMRASQAQATDPGTMQDHVTALVVPMTSGEQAERARAVSNEITAALKSGQDLSALGAHYSGDKAVQFTPSIWVSEEALPADIKATVKTLKPGETTPSAIRTANSLQFVKLVERKLVKKVPSSTEVSIKQITVDLPVKPKKPITDKVAATQKILQQNPGSCEEATIPTLPFPAEAKFARIKIGDMSADQRNIIERMNVGDVSEPLMAPGKLRMVVLCERVESVGSVADENLRQQLFSEKLELEAQKHLRNLRRDATIDIRSDDLK